MNSIDLLPETRIALTSGWIGFLFGVLSGAVIGMFFHRDEWLGGYDSFRRRMLRLGHISFFGLGFVNLFFALTHQFAALPAPFARAALTLFLIGAVTMPLSCFLSAWRKPYKALFPIPVASVAAGICLVIWRLCL